ncbi:unnamed protein product [Nezara viridula]|uniref:C3 and PZP-like alpha-2-macroglobulin domain-containing protein 8 n=1 Tax=Nezara viridula TaxID=85310 RepID=A0A9P0MPU0_NEZVI|nr:unnamed protein product [Nezara viridula]
MARLELELEVVISRLESWNKRAPTRLMNRHSSGPERLITRQVEFTVEAVMAPVSHLLVYYVTDQGEPISDVISFDVKLFQRQVSVNIEQKKFWYPGQVMDLQILSDLDSLVCLVGGRGGDLHSQKMSKGLELDLSEAGVSYFWDDCGGRQEVRPAHHGVHHSIMPEAGLEQLWLWQCFNYTSDVEATGLRLKAPPEPGKWSLGALSVSQAMGLRFSYPIVITVFQPIDVEFHLPAGFRAGESLEVDIKIGNNLNSCVDVNALLTLSEGAHFLGSSQPFVAEKLRLGPHGATSLVVRVVATSPGVKNMTVEVSAYNSDTCQSMTTEKGRNHSMVGIVTKQQSILVSPEGLVKTHIESAYFCANEQMVLSTAEEFRYEFIPAPRNREASVFEVRAGRGLHIALSEVQNISQRMYQVVIGDLDNSVSWIGRGKHGYSVHLMTKSTPQILSSDESRTFWMSWDRGVLSFGKGPQIHDSVILKWRMEKKMKVNFLGFATTWGQAAEIRVWNFNDEAGFSQVLHLDIPRSVLPGSETGTLLVAGGLSLPSLKISPRPSLSEYSSLATTISSIAPLIAHEGLKIHINITKNGERQDLINSLGSNIQKLLLFKKDDNSFSDHHNMTSLWSSVEVLDLLSRVQSIMSIDPGLVQNLKKWVQSNQEEDGSFKPHFMDITPDNMTGCTDLERTISTTADALAALINIGIENDNDSKVILKAKRYLEANIDSTIDGCTLAMLCYALVSVKSEKTGAALERLKNASTNEEGDFGWPRPRDNSDWLYEEGMEQKKQPVTNMNSHLKEFKASLYTLMTYTLRDDLKSAEPVARYLFYRANILDTHTELIFTAVKAFSQFGWLAHDPNRWLTVSLATSGMELTDTLELRANSSPQILNLPSLPTKVFVYATGAGCATVQGQISYATYSSSKTTNLFDLWAGVTEEIMPRRNSIQELEGKLPLLNIKTCFKWKGPEISGVIRLEVHLFSGFELLSVAPNQLDIDYGSRADRVWFVVSNVTTQCAVCIEFTAKSDYIIGRLRPAFARVYPSGRADLAAELFFHTRRGSPLLLETSEDDLITWFGSSRAGESDGMSSDFSEICACGQVCFDTPTFSATTDSAIGHSESEEVKQEDSNDFTDIIVFSDLHENLSTTEGELRTIEDLTNELGFNTTTGGFTVGSSHYTNINLDFQSTAVTTEIPTTKKSIIIKTTTVPPKHYSKSKQKDIKQKLLMKSKSTPHNSLNAEIPVESILKKPEFKREKHVDMISNVLNVTESTFSTLAPFLNHPHLLSQITGVSSGNNHIIITNITDSDEIIPQPNGVYVNRELKEPTLKSMLDVTAKPSVQLTAEEAKESRESMLEHGHESPMEILREGLTEGYQSKSPAG